MGGRILVTGSSGYVGNRVLHALAAEGHPLRAMVRERSSASVPGGAEVVGADLTHPDELPMAVSEIDTVVHCAAITADLKEPYPGAYDAINRGGTSNLVKAAQQAGVKRMVVMSGLGTRPAKDGTYMATRWGMEEAVRRSGLSNVILRPSVLFGKNAAFVRGLAGLVRSAPVVPLVAGSLRFQPLWVEDLTRCLVRATNDASFDGRAIEVGGGEQLTMRQMLETIQQALGVAKRMVPVPVTIARFQAGLMERVMKRPPLTPAAAELFTFDNVTQLDSVDLNFGFAARAFRDHVAEHGLD
jgi:uncharacterized protein YbjT (DUF2867 family)